MLDLMTPASALELWAADLCRGGFEEGGCNNGRGRNGKKDRPRVSNPKVTWKTPSGAHIWASTNTSAS